MGQKKSSGVSTRDRGASVIEFAIIALPLLFITFIVIQAALVFYARSTALAAATQGAQAARAYGADPQVAGKNRAKNFLNVAGDGLRNTSEPVVAVTATDVTVTVNGDAISVIPWLDFDVSQSASGPIERFVP